MFKDGGSFWIFSVNNPLGYSSLESIHAIVYIQQSTPPKSNIDTKNDVVFNVSPFKYGYFGYLC